MALMHTVWDRRARVGETGLCGAPRRESVSVINVMMQ